MDKIKIWWDGYKPTRRRLIQLYAALLHNANLKGFIEGEIYTGVTKNVCVPGLNCYSCPAAAGACPLGALQNALSASGARAPYYVLGIIMLFGLSLGRTVCGWLCPMGLIQELLHRLPTPKVRKSRFTRALSWLKYVILAVFVLAVPLIYGLRGRPLPAFCKYICPAGTMEGAVALLSHPANADRFSMLGGLFTGKFLILVITVTVCVFVYRAFCRFICPLGAIYSLFAKMALTGVRAEPTKCVGCGICVSCCPMDIRAVGDRECISCGKCVNACPTKAIDFKCGSVSLSGLVKEKKEAEKPAFSKREKAAWIAALLILAAVLWGYNRPEPRSTPAEAEISTEVGFAVGELCPDFTAPLYAPRESSFALAEQKGKVVVINFWATWCTPCVDELPHFQKIYENYGDDVSVIALHSELVTDDVQSYLDEKAYTLPFALDESGDIIRSLGGSTMLPMTVVLGRNGIITYNAVGSVSYEKLESIIEPLL